ncbi:cytochrome P450 [Polymorphobacter glacialis]|uniref:Cytochrome P450 n=1 Tax=Sandarakinorhabdus glacialis TaxID=1614636 RepID=A0A917A1R6_9SPHN|nr:cytochrome P450 [Polymorphobacter glacialis]GGE22297.1 cytochrome P450 [Polymorphobacter glacialis]
MATQLQHDDSLALLDVSRMEIWRDDAWRAPFQRLLTEAPVHYCADSIFGPYWSITRHADIMAVEAHPEIFSSSYEYGGITIADILGDMNLPQFIAMDRPKHTGQRRVVSPAFGPAEITRMAASIRQRTTELLDTLPFGKEFDWVDTVSVELTTGMLAILFDFPWQDRRLLTLWSDWGGDIEAAVDPVRAPIRHQHLLDMTEYFDRLFAERKARAPTGDLISMMVHSDAMGDMKFKERTGNLILLIVGGNDTTRNSMSGSIHAFHQYPDQWDKLLADPSLIPAAVPEAIRWQTPLSHMRRTANQDTEIAGTPIAKGEKVVLWYIAANREESVFPGAERLDISRANARRHLSFGFGIHRCVGARLAELQLQILFEEMVARKWRVRVTGEPAYVPQSFVHGYTRLPVMIDRS